MYVPILPNIRVRIEEFSYKSCTIDCKRQECRLLCWNYVLKISRRSRSYRKTGGTEGCLLVFSEKKFFVGAAALLAYIVLRLTYNINIQTHNQSCRDCVPFCYVKGQQGLKPQMWKQKPREKHRRKNYTSPFVIFVLKVGSEIQAFLLSPTASICFYCIPSTICHKRISDLIRRNA